MNSEFQLQNQLNDLNMKYKSLHSKLKLADKTKDEEKIRSLLSKIQTIARQQSKIKEAQNGTNQNL